MEIKLLSKDELTAYAQSFCRLYRSCFNDYIDEQIVIRRYLDNPCDDLYMCVAVDNGELVSNYAVSPSSIEYKNRNYKAALSLNTMTHPDYMGKGLFINLATRLYDKLKTDGYKLVYGCPNFISNRPLCCRLNWKDIYEVPTMELVLSDGLQYNCISIHETDACNLSIPVIDTTIHVGKPSEYMTWRYSNHPTNHYMCIKSDMNGWAIYKVYQNMVNIVELHSFDSNDLLNLIGYIINFAHQNNLEKLTVWSKINTTEHFMLEKIGFRNRYPITYFGALDLGLSEILDVDIWDYRNWSINMGDDNVY